MNGLPYYKAYPRDFIEGTVGMPFEIKAAYRLLLDLIYMQGGRLPDDARYISGLLGCSVKKWNSLRQALIEAGKIHAIDGYLGNYRADKELETLGKFQDKQRKNASGSRKNKDLEKPRLNHTEPEPEPDLEANASKSNSARVQVRETLEREASPEAVDSFIAYRSKTKAKALTLTAAKRLAANLRAIIDGGGCADDALGLAEERGWQTIKPDWYFKEARNDNRTHPQNRHSRADAETRIIAFAARAGRAPSSDCF